MNQSFFVENQEVGSFDVLFNIETKSEIFDKYFKNQGIDKSKKEKILKQINNDKVTIIEFITVKPEFRKKGYGQRIIESIILKTNSPILLIAEKRLDFLESWYENNKFEVIDRLNDLPIMLRNFN